MLELRRGEHFDERTLSLIRDIRSRLVEPFRSLSDLDLMVEDLFMVGTKPGTGVH